MIGQSIQLSESGAGVGAGAATGLMGSGAGAGSGIAVEQPARASSAKGRRRGIAMILIAKEYGQKDWARLVLISDVQFRTQSREATR